MSEQDSIAKVIKELRELAEFIGWYEGGPAVEELADRLQLLHSWQPIDTAPKDGTRVLVYYPPPANASIDVVVYNHARERWPMRVNLDADDTLITATHWQPLPEPPKA